MEKHILSKSTFQRGIQCAKSLYLYKHFIHLRDPLSVQQKAVFSRGNNVGVLAHKLFEGGIDVSKIVSKRTENYYSELVDKTKELIDNGTEVIYEAAFQHNQVLVILDMLVKKDGQWFGYEVKSSTRITQTYLIDASLQYWVITKSGLALEDMSIVLINNQYTRKGALNISELFKIQSVKGEVLLNQEMIEQQLTALKEVALSSRMPAVKIGEHCFSPYTCDFTGTCWKDVPDLSVFDMNGVQKAELFNLYNAGYRTIDDIPAENNLDKNANIHIQAHKSGNTLVDKVEIQRFLSKISYPLFFMDFETFMPAVPIYDTTKPYQHIPFQYSLHYKKNKDAPLEHFYFLGEQGRDPRKAFLESLLKHISTQGTILVYDVLMEKNVLNGLKQEYPEYTADVDAVLNRFVDLITPFREKSYYHPAMKNSFSIKNILHALVPELSYTNLSISSGSLAMTAFESLQTETDMFKILEVRDHLLKYCELDTLAMVKLWEILERTVEA